MPVDPSLPPRPSGPSRASPLCQRLGLSDQVGEPCVQSLRQLLHGVDRWLIAQAFDPADEDRRDAGAPSQCLLRQIQRLAPPSWHRGKGGNACITTRATAGSKGRVRHGCRAIWSGSRCVRRSRPGPIRPRLACNSTRPPRCGSFAAPPGLWPAGRWLSGPEPRPDLWRDGTGRGHVSARLSSNNPPPPPPKPPSRAGVRCKRRDQGCFSTTGECSWRRWVPVAAALPAG